MRIAAMIGILLGVSLFGAASARELPRLLSKPVSVKLCWRLGTGADTCSRLVCQVGEFCETKVRYYVNRERWSLVSVMVGARANGTAKIQWLLPRTDGHSEGTAPDVPKELRVVEIDFRQGPAIKLLAGRWENDGVDVPNWSARPMPPVLRQPAPDTYRLTARLAWWEPCDEDEECPTVRPLTKLGY